MYKKNWLHAHIYEALVHLGMYLCAEDKLRIIKIIISLVIINEGSFLYTHSFFISFLPHYSIFLYSKAETRILCICMHIV